jgi:hypothetical protein
MGIADKFEYYSPSNVSVQLVHCRLFSHDIAGLIILQNIPHFSFPLILQYLQFFAQWTVRLYIADLLSLIDALASNIYKHAL